LRPNRQRCPDRFAFKKTCPFEFTRHVQPQADTKAWRSFLPSLVSQCEFKKGKSGFLAKRWDSRPLGFIMISNQGTTSD